MSSVSSRVSLRQPPFAVLLGIAWLLVAIQLISQGWVETGKGIADTDDALRLVEMRNFLAGNGWFDMREPRLGLPPGYESHWSRLIDVGLAGVFLFFRLFTDVAMAERLMGVTWPLLWLIPAMIGVAAIAWRLAGREAALIVLVLATFNIPGLQQFVPGRIDHHNVQITLALASVAAMMWSDRVRWAAAAAGTFTGWSLAIGLEALPIHALCGAALALRYMVEPDAAKPLRHYGLALAASTALAFLVSVGPEHWFRSLCDAIAVNLASAVIVAGLGVGLVARSGFGTRSRTAAMIGVGIATIVVFAAFEPQCLRGPYSQLDPAVWPIWMSRVIEMQSIWTLAKSVPSTAAQVVAFPMLALIAVMIVSRREGAMRDFGFWLATAVFLISLATTIEAVRAYAYVVWIGMPFVAVAAKQVFDRLALNSLVPRVFAAILLAPSIVTGGALSLAVAAGSHESPDKNTPIVRDCINRDNMGPIAALPRGLMVPNEPDWGPYLLAWTPHSVLAAPYHRVSDLIVMTHRIFSAPPETARAMLSDIKADYLVNCGTRGPVGVTGAKLDASLWAALQNGALPGWLEPVTLEPPGPLAVYRVKR